VDVTEGRDGLEVLEVDECWTLVRSKAIGRLAVNRTGRGPHVVPINYIVDDGSIVFRSGEGTKLDATERGILTLQVDEVDQVHHVGWSVILEGVASWVYDRTDDTPVDTWAPGEHPYLVRLHPEHVSGRRIRLVQPDTDRRGYR
jgi:uncharacterized protein